MANPEHLRIARDGKSGWNSWRLTHPSERVDFTGTDFTVGENRDIVFSGFEFDCDADAPRCLIQLSFLASFVGHLISSQPDLTETVQPVGDC